MIFVAFVVSSLAPAPKPLLNVSSQDSSPRFTVNSIPRPQPRNFTDTFLHLPSISIVILKWGTMVAFVLTCFYSIFFNIFFLQDIDYYNVTSVFLGVGVICVWVGLLRFVTYFKEYNVHIHIVYIHFSGHFYVI